MKRNFTVKLKNKTSDYYGYIAEVFNCSLPNVEDILELNQKEYLVKEIRRNYGKEYLPRIFKDSEYIVVYVQEL